MTLHRAVEVSRKFLIVFGTIFFGLILILMLFTVGSGIKDALFPSPPPPPNLRFGKIDSNVFPKSPVEKTPTTYSLNTVSGSLPSLPDEMSVYKILQAQPSLLGLDNITQLLKTNNFSDPPTPLSETRFEWTNSDPSQKIDFNIVTGDFVFSKDYLNDPNVLAATSLTDEQTAQQMAKEFFTNFKAYPTDIDDSKTQTSLYKIQNGELVPAPSLSSANLIRVDFFQKDINKTPIYYENYPNSPMFALIGSTDKSSEIVSANFTHKTILTDFEATYPIITASDAFDQLKNGKAYISSYDGTSSTVIIRGLSLGYFIASGAEQYTVPIIVFSGDNNFFAFVPAIKE